MERINYIGKPYMLTESQESSSQKEAIRYVEQHFGWSHEKSNNFVRIDLRNDITALRDKKIGKFTLGVTRMFCNNELSDASIISDLNSTLKLLSAHLNEYDRNLNGLSAQELIQRFAQTRQNNLEAEKDELNAMKFESNSNYNIVPINSFEEAQQYYQYTNPNSRWCLTHMEDMFDRYTCDGINQIYFCLQNGFESIPPKVGKGAPLDEYGLSMLSIIINERGELAYCTTRWNHDNGGSDSSMSAKEISQVVGVNFYDVFKPNNKWKELVQTAQQHLANGENLRDVFDKVWNFHEGFGKVELSGKYNFINQEGQLISDQWYDYAYDFHEGFAAVVLNEKFNFINQEGHLLSNQWYDNVWDFQEGFARVNLNGSYNLINQNGERISQQWYDWIDYFKEGFARVMLNKNFNLINQEGQLLSDQWFDEINNFYKGLPEVKLDGKLYKLDTNGRLHNINENKLYKTNKNMGQRIILSESDLHRMIKESVKQVINESYNDKETIKRVEDLHKHLVSFTEYLEENYNFANEGRDFVDKIYHAANELDGELSSFLYDNHQQEIYGY